jgi:RND family efflux transporter MFP subunit
MRRVTTSQTVLWSTALLGLAGILLGAYFVHGWMNGQKSIPAEPSIQKDADVIKVGVERANLIGLKDKPAELIDWIERVPVYGQVVPNPRASFDVRMAFAGTLRAVSESPWPSPGEWVRAGQVLGRLEVRVGPQERLDWQAKLNEARLKQHGAEEVLKIEQARIDRFKSLSAGDVVSRRELDDALLRFAEAKTQLATAQAAVRLWQEALAQSDKPGNGVTLWNQSLTVPADGEVTELLARPGTVVEAGAVIARLVDFRRPLIRLDLPLEVLAAGPPQHVSVSTLQTVPAALGSLNNGSMAGRASPALPATLVGAAPQIDVASQRAPYSYEAAEKDNDRRKWRPGLFAKAEIALSDSPKRPAVAVPASALLYHQGRALVYLRVDTEGWYQKREVEVYGREGDRWVIKAGERVKVGDRVVYEQAQVLLSQEFNTDND